MPKTSGLGDALYVGGSDLSGDIQALDTIGAPMSPIDVTAINKYAMERIGGLRDGVIDYTAFFNPDGAHPILAALPTADEILTYCRGTDIGSPAACMVAKQIGYDPTRTDAGELTFKVQAQANGYGLEWGQLLTAGVRTDTGATSPATGLDTGASLSLGGQAYLHVMALTGTNVVLTIQDSANNSTFANVTSFAFTSATTAPQAQRIAIGNTATIRRYIRVISSGTFTSASFAVAVVKNTVAGQVF